MKTRTLLITLHRETLQQVFDWKEQKQAEENGQPHSGHDLNRLAAAIVESVYEAMIKTNLL